MPVITGEEVIPVAVIKTETTRKLSRIIGKPFPLGHSYWVEVSHPIIMAKP